MAQILKLLVGEMNSKFTIRFTEEAEKWFVKKGYSLEFGARPMRRLLESELEIKIADVLLDKPESVEFDVAVVDNEITVTG